MTGSRAILEFRRDVQVAVFVILNYDLGIPPFLWNLTLFMGIFGVIYRFLFLFSFFDIDVAEIILHLIIFELLLL